MKTETKKVYCSECKYIGWSGTFHCKKSYIKLPGDQIRRPRGKVYKWCMHKNFSNECVDFEPNTFEKMKKFFKSDDINKIISYIESVWKYKHLLWKIVVRDLKKCNFGVFKKNFKEQLEIILIPAKFKVDFNHYECHPKIKEIRELAVKNFKKE